MEEENYSENSETSSKISTNTLTVRHAADNTLHFRYDLSTINRINERRDSEFTYTLDFEEQNQERDSLLAFCPIEVYERNFLRNMQQKQSQSEAGTSSSSMLTVREDLKTV